MEMNSRHVTAKKKTNGSIRGLLILYGLLWLFLIFSVGKGVPLLIFSVTEGEPRLPEITWVGALGFGVGLVLFLFLTNFLYRSSFYEQLGLRSLRGTAIYSICLAFFFSIGFLLIGLENIVLFLRGYSFGLIAGIFSGWPYMRMIEKKIVGDKIISAGGFSDNMQFKNYWKEYLIILAIWGAFLIFAGVVFRSRSACFGTVAGLHLGACWYFLLWVYLYEKQNNLRITFE